MHHHDKQRVKLFLYTLCAHMRAAFTDSPKDINPSPVYFLTDTSVKLGLPLVFGGQFKFLPLIESHIP